MELESVMVVQMVPNRREPPGLVAMRQQLHVEEERPKALVLGWVAALLFLWEWEGVEQTLLVSAAAFLTM
jgi:hypothetical protein